MQTNEIYAAKAFQRLGADYVLVYFTYLVTNLGGDEGKWQWMLRICNDNYEYYKDLGMEEDNWKDNSVFDEDEYTTPGGVKKDNWFDSQLAKLMFWGVPTTNPGTYSSQTLVGVYTDRINNWKDDDGATWASHIPEAGEYESNVFIPVYMHEKTPAQPWPSSKYGLVKLFKVDYTVLESQFEIQNAKIFDSGYGTFSLKNTGTKDLVITNVSINGQDHDFAMGKGLQSNTLEAGDDDLVWIDFTPGLYSLGDVVSIKVTAEAEGIQHTIDITNRTSNFFVTQAEVGDIRINRENSRVIQKNPDSVDIFLEIENTGASIITIDSYYANTESNTFDTSSIEYLSGSSILASGEKALVRIADVPSTKADFYPLYEEHNLIGVVTPDGIRDETLFSSSYANYNVTIIGIDRIVSPEILLTTNNDYRYHIPVDFDKSHAYSYDNGTSRIYINVKNTALLPINFQSVYITNSGSWDKVDLGDFWIASGSFYLNPGEEDMVIVNVDESKYFDIDINDEIGIKIIGAKGSEPHIAASDVGYTHTVTSQSSITILENVSTNIADISSISASFFHANESGSVLIKNTGNDIVQLDTSNIKINGTLATNVEIISGSEILGIQECAILSFTVNETLLDTTQATYISVNVTTNSSIAYDTINLPVNYNIEIDSSNSSASNSGDSLEVFVNNYGQLNVTISSIYINSTLIDLNNFTGAFEIDSLGGYVNISMTLSALVTYNIMTAPDIAAGKKLEILIRTQEGAEDEYTITIGV